MLQQFRFKNFKSFKDEATLDLTAAEEVSEYGWHVFGAGDEKFLPVSVIFGANASGKTNALEAFRFMVGCVMESRGYGGDHHPTLRPFLMDPASRGAASEFEVNFAREFNGKLRFWNYGFTVGKDGVEEEWLNFKEAKSEEFTPVFYRDRGEVEFCLEGLREKRWEDVAVETLALSQGAGVEVEILECVRGWFAECVFSDLPEVVMPCDLASTLPPGFAWDEEVQAEVLRYLSAFDGSIVGFDVGTEVPDSGGVVVTRVRTRHRVMGADDTVTLDLADEASGVLKLLAIYTKVEKVLLCGGRFVVDELDARLHPLLMRSFMLQFLLPERNPNHAQLVCTAHDSWQLESDLLRRDEIWFTDKDVDGRSELYCLSDFVDDDGARISKEENFAKGYLLGKFGAIPTLTGFRVLDS